MPGPLGPLPAWQLAGTRPTWVLLVHGRGGAREDWLAMLPALVRAGFPVLDLSYRNDVGAPASPDGYSHLGDTEWRDVEAGVRYARAEGAADVVL